MNKMKYYGLFAIAAAIVFVGLLWRGVPVGAFGLLLVIACPVMMMFMMGRMGGMGGMDDDHRDRSASDHDRHDHGSSTSR